MDTAAGFTYAWSVTDNGSPYASGTSAGFTFTPDASGTYVVTLTATDKDGGVSQPASATIIVDSVAPTATITGAPASGHSPEGTAISLGSTVTDASPAETAAGFTYAWSVSDNGSPYASGSAANFSFTPSDNGTYVVSLTATDEDGNASQPATATITVDNVAPTAAITGTPSSGHSPEGTSITVGSTVTDPSSVDTAAGFTYAWSITDNGSAYASGSAANFSFTPDDNGTYVATLTATDKDGGVSQPASAAPSSWTTWPRRRQSPARRRAATAPKEQPSAWACRHRPQLSGHRRRLLRSLDRDQERKRLRLGHRGQLQLHAE